MCFGRNQLDCILTIWIRYYIMERSHRGVGRDNTVLDETFIPKNEGVVRSKEELGSVVRSNYRKAA